MFSKQVKMKNILFLLLFLNPMFLFASEFDDTCISGIFSDAKLLGEFDD
jgi:hypothetical protein